MTTIFSGACASCGKPLTDEEFASGEIYCSDCLIEIWGDDPNSGYMEPLIKSSKDHAEWLFMGIDSELWHNYRIYFTDGTHENVEQWMYERLQRGAEAYVV